MTSWDDSLMVILMWFFFYGFLCKSINCWYSFEWPQLVEAIQMSTNNICFKNLRHALIKAFLRNTLIFSWINKKKKYLDTHFNYLAEHVWCMRIQIDKTFFYIVLDGNRPKLTLANGDVGKNLASGDEPISRTPSTPQLMSPTFKVFLCVYMP